MNLKIDKITSESPSQGVPNLNRVTATGSVTSPKNLAAETESKPASFPPLSTNLIAALMQNKNISI